MYFKGEDVTDKITKACQGISKALINNSACVADREIRDRMIEMSKAEERLYKDVEEYISRTYDAASQKEKNAVGFILTVYRRRLASSVYALKKTLLRRLDGLTPETNEEDLPQDETADEVLSPEDAQALASEGLKLIEAADIKILLKQIEKVGVESKAKRLGDAELSPYQQERLAQAAALAIQRAADEIERFTP